MPRRRTAGEGTVYQTKNGRWAAMLELPRQPNGKRHRKLRRARTQTEAKRLLAEMRREYETNGSVAPKNRKMVDTLSEYLAVRIDAGRSKSTLDRDRRFCSAMSVYFRNRRTSDLSVHECDRFLAKFSVGGCSDSQVVITRDHVRRARSFLIGALNNDIRLGYLHSNVAKVTVLPPSSKSVSEKRALSAEEWQRLFESAEGIAKLVVDLGGRHGLRPQEVRALRWENLNLDSAVLRVTKQFDAENQFVDPKTRRSFRKMRLHHETVNLLRSRRQAQIANRRKYSEIWVAQDLVISTRRGTPVNKDNVRRTLHRLCRNAGIDPISPYELRHTAITHQIAAGCTVSQVADWAGTSEKMIYLHYRHQLQEVVELGPASLERGSGNRLGYQGELK